MLFEISYVNKKRQATEIRASVSSIYDYIPTSIKIPFFSQIFPEQKFNSIIALHVTVEPFVNFPPSRLPDSFVVRLLLLLLGVCYSRYLIFSPQADTFCYLAARTVRPRYQITKKKQLKVTSFIYTLI